jgi:uncharacterized membrane protein
MQANTVIMVGVMFIFAGGMIAALALPLIKRNVKMNALYGIRIPKAFESEEAWYAINEYGGRMLLKSSFVWFVSGAAAIALPFLLPQEMISSNLILVLVIAIPMAITLAGIIPIIRFASKI